MTARAVIIDPPRGVFRIGFRSLWEYRGLLYFLVWRDLKVRYRQTVVGVGWAVLQPVAAMLIFTLVFGHFVRVPSDGFPYPIFAYCALLPWNYFASALNRCVVSVVGNAHLISKIYFPRLLLPLSSTLSGLADFAVAFLLLLGMMVWYRISLTWAILAVPFLLLLAVATVLAVGLWLSALNVRFRDVGLAIPLIVQLWMFASPVAYPVSLVPERWRLVYALNPMAGVIEGFRWALLGKESPDPAVLVISAAAVLLALLGGLAFFRRMEDSFADVV